MLSLYQSNGLVHWTDREIRLRDMMTAHFAAEVAAFLTAANPAWDTRREGTVRPDRFCQTDQRATAPCRRSFNRSSMASIRSTLRSRCAS